MKKPEIWKLGINELLGYTVRFYDFVSVHINLEEYENIKDFLDYSFPEF